MLLLFLELFQYEGTSIEKKTTNSESRSPTSKIISRNGRHKFEICRGSVAFLARPLAVQHHEIERSAYDTR